MSVHASCVGASPLPHEVETRDELMPDMRAVTDAREPIIAAFITDWASSSTPKFSSLLYPKALPTPMSMPASAMEAATIMTAIDIPTYCSAIQVMVLG